MRANEFLLERNIGVFTIRSTPVLSVTDETKTKVIPATLKSPRLRRRFSPSLFSVSLRVTRVTGVPYVFLTFTGVKANNSMIRAEVAYVRRALGRNENLDPGCRSM